MAYEEDDELSDGIIITKYPFGRSMTPPSCNQKWPYVYMSEGRAYRHQFGLYHPDFYGTRTQLPNVPYYRESIHTAC